MSAHHCVRILLCVLSLSLVLPDCLAKTGRKMAPSDGEPTPSVPSSTHAQGQLSPKPQAPAAKKRPAVKKPLGRILGRARPSSTVTEAVQEDGRL